MAAHAHFYAMETETERHEYLMNCIENVQKTKNSVDADNAEENNENYFHKLTENATTVSPNIQLEIENESNGNKKLSDEIQNAINESLKDYIVIEEKDKNKTDSFDETQSTTSDKEEKNNWNYHVIIDGSKKKVCLQFLLKLLRITKTTIKQLQKRILSGTI